MIQNILEQLGFDWKVALANLVNFLIIFYLLRNVVFKKIGIAIKERQDKIKKGLEDAKLAEEALLLAESEQEKIIKEAHKESRLIADQAKKEALEAKEKTLKLAEKEAEEIKAKKLLEIERYKEEENKKMRLAYVDLVVAGVERVTIKNIDKKSSEELISSLVSN